MLWSENCTGHIEWKGQHLDIEFGMSCAKDGQITVDLGSVPLNEETQLLDRLFHTEGIEYFSLRGRDSNGREIWTESAYLTSCGTQLESGDVRIVSKGTAAEVGLYTPTGHKAETAQAKAQVLYRTVGMRCWAVPSADTPLGLVEIRGSHEIKDYGEIVGVLSIKHESLAEDEIRSWLEECDVLAKSILDVLSLADGRLIRWSVREFFREEKLRSIRFLGPRKSSQPFQPIFHFLNFQPILDLAIQNYTQDLRDKTGIDVAIEWFLMNPTHTEAQFLVCMTALEHLLATYSKDLQKRERSTLYLPKSIFEKTILSALEGTLQSQIGKLSAELGLSSEDEDFRKVLAAFKGKLRGMNNKSLRSKLDSMLQDYDVPLEGIRESINHIIPVRNDIAHRGYFDQAKRTKEPLSSHLDVLRELLKRTFLALLNYKGRYQSFLDGHGEVEFPPGREDRS